MAKPTGVGIDKIPIHKLIKFGVEHGYIEKDEFGNVPLAYGALLPDWAIREFVTIEDFIDYDECPKGAVSYGLTSSGYDIRVGGVFKVFTNANCETISPRNIPKGAFLDQDLTGHVWAQIPNEKTPVCAGCGVSLGSPETRMRCQSPKPGTPASIKIPPNSFALAETVEVLYIPRNINCLCLGKSTYARCGIIMNFTPFEPGWFGVVTVEITNSTPLPVEIFAWEGIGQAQFTLTVGSPQMAYGDKKNAKYQGQTGLTLPSVK